MQTNPGSVLSPKIRLSVLECYGLSLDTGPGWLPIFIVWRKAKNLGQVNPHLPSFPTCTPNKVGLGACAGRPPLGAASIGHMPQNIKDSPDKGRTPRPLATGKCRSKRLCHVRLRVHR